LNLGKMNDPESRLNDALLPIGQNSVGQDQQGRQRQQQQQQQQSTRGETWNKTKKCCCWTTVILVVVTIFLIISMKLFFFKPVNHKPPKLDNSTAIEPNTKTHYRLLFSGPKARTQSLVGLSVWTYKVPIPTHPEIAISAVGYYLDRTDGKKRLKSWEDKEIDDDNFQDLENSLVKVGITETLRYVLATTPPSGRMIQMFKENTEKILKRICPDGAEEQFEKFQKFFSRSKVVRKR